MNITSIPQLYRNVNRLKDIITVLGKYGLADWLGRFEIDLVEKWVKGKDGGSLTSLSFEQKMRMVLTELGPTFIKLGQVLSTRSDLIGPEMAEELKHLQADVPADSPEFVKKRVEAELEGELDELFATFDLVPLASASIGQVHLATLKSGESVVVKVQHEGIEEKVREDLEILAGLAQLAEKVPELRLYQPKATVSEFDKSLSRELDFSWEARNLATFGRFFEEHQKVKIPLCFPRYSTKRIMTMEHLAGTRLRDPEKLREDGFALDLIAKTGAEIFLKMIFTYGVFHADPHPGNFFLLPENVIGLIDFGMVGRLDEPLREDIEDMLMSIANRDAEQLTSTIIRLGSVPRNTDISGLSGDVSDFVSYYATQSMEDFDIGNALNEMMSIVRRYHIVLPAQIALLIKVLITLEGTSRLLNPQFNFMEIMRPFQQELIMRRLSPQRQLKKARRLQVQIARIADLLPQQVLEITERLQKGTFDVPLEHRGLETSTNRIVLGMLSSALFVGSSLMLSFKAPPVLHWMPTFTGLTNVSLFGLIGFFFSFAMGVRILRAVRKSGYLEARDDS